MKKYIPNLCTSLNVFSGCIACVMAFNGEYLWVVAWVIIGAIFDFFDGFTARLFNAPSAIGKELDSLADMVTFGLAPSIMAFHYLSEQKDNISSFAIINDLLPYLAFLIAIFSALRLAKFNIDERQTSSFIGLPTPANAMFWVSFLYGIKESESPLWLYATIVLILVFSFLMVSEMPMFSLKAKKFGFKGNELRYILIIFFILALAILQIPGIATGIVFYIGISAVSSIKQSPQEL